MSTMEVRFHNRAALRVQAQIFDGFTLLSTCVADPDEVCIMSAAIQRYDIYFKNSTTGKELARKLDHEAAMLTLSLEKGRFVVT